MPFSGTVSTTVFNVGKVIDRAFGRCKLAPQQITPEYIQIAKDLLYAFLSTLGNEGIPLWAQKKMILPIYEGVQDVLLDPQVIDVLNANLRTSTRLTGIAQLSSEGDPSLAFDSNLATACVQVTPGGYIACQLGASFNPSTFGFMPNVSGTWDFAFQVSGDGVTWRTVYTGSQVSVVDGEWFWADVQGIPEVGVTWLRMLALNTTVLNVTELVFEDAPNEIPIAKVNRDDYANLPNKWFTGRPVQFWYDKQVPNPILTLWPVPQFQYTFNQIVLYVNRYIMDVGDLTDSIEVPQRWLLAIITELGRQLAMNIPEVKTEVLMYLGPEADSSLKKAWASETDQSPTFLRPRIWNYTR
jgi:hypothetical protein